jgi:pyruvate dehydrogenase E2 component (dihydrolipoamide acetyltransferase)
LPDETATTSRGDVTVVEPTRPQQVLARRVAEAKAIVPEVQTTFDADVTAATSLVLAPDDLVLRATALVLRETPRANAAYRDGKFELYSRVNIGVAVSAQDALVVPTIYDADGKPAAQLAAERRELTERARTGGLAPADTRGATFTFQSVAARSYTPIITAPQAATLAVGAVRDEARVEDGEVVARRVVTLTLVSDGRLLYGDEAAAFLARIDALLQSPAAL